MNKRLLGALAALLALLGTTALGYWTGKENGIAEGIDKYHNLCYNGGIVVHPDSGKVVKCEPLGIISEEEIMKYMT